MAEDSPFASFASVGEYCDLYGTPDRDSVERLPSILLRATGYLLSYYDGTYTRGEDPVFDLNAGTVTCAMAHRALSAPKGLEGVSQYSQTAGSYSVSASLLDQYMRPLASELEMLGLSSGVVLTTSMEAPC